MIYYMVQYQRRPLQYTLAALGDIREYEIPDEISHQ